MGSNSNQTSQELNKSLYYQGRILKVRNRKLLYDEVLGALKETTVILFLDFFHDVCIDLSEEHKKLPGTTSFSQIPKVLASLYWVDCGMLYLHTFLFYKSQNAMSKKFGIPRSSVQSVLKFMEEKVRISAVFLIFQCAPFSEAYLSPFSYERRLEFTQDMINHGEMDPKYKRITLSMDGTHNLVEIHKNNPEGKHWSYKMKDSAYNILVCFFFL
jgi:hypothetical protein